MSRPLTINDTWDAELQYSAGRRQMGKMFAYARKELAIVIPLARAQGMGIRQIARYLGISKDTPRKYLRNEASEPLCGCGKPVGHKGWCPVRFAESTVRQEWLARQHARRSRATYQKNNASPTLRKGLSNTEAGSEPKESEGGEWEGSEKKG